MFSSLVEFFAAEKKLPHTKKQRSTSLQGSLPTILFTTTCIDLEPLSPLTNTDPINVPLTYHDHGKPYSSSLDSLSTSRSNSLTSSTSSYGCPATPFSSSLSSDDDDDDDDRPLSFTFTTPPHTTSIHTSSVDPLSCADMNASDHQRNHDRKEKKHHTVSAAPKPTQQLQVTTKIESKVITKMALFANIRHSLSLLVSPSFTSMSWTVPSTPVPTTAPIITTTTTNTSPTAIDNVLYEVDEEEHTMTAHPVHDRRSPYPQAPMYTRARSPRENPDHLRILISEINMMKVNKLISPLRPRAILLERSDPFIPSTPSPLRYTV